MGVTLVTQRSTFCHGPAHQIHLRRRASCQGDLFADTRLKTVYRKFEHFRALLAKIKEADFETLGELEPFHDM